MEIKNKLNKPYTEKQRINFIVEQNHTLGYEIRETDIALEAWGYTEEEKQQQARQHLDALTLTPSDVERALYYGMGIDFDDLKALIAEKAPQIDLKGLAIEFRANNFYRGAVDKDGNRIIDTVGMLLGFTSEDMDYLFQNKQLPPKEEAQPEPTPTPEETEQEPTVVPEEPEPEATPTPEETEQEPTVAPEVTEQEPLENPLEEQS